MPFIKERNKRHRLKGAMLSLCLILSALNVRVLSAPQQDVNLPIRVRVFTMRNISAVQAKDYLTQAQVADTIVIIPGTNAVSVTAKPQQLVYAGSILKVVDSNQQFDIQFLDVKPDSKTPDNTTIQTKLGKGFSVGTLLEGPSASAAVKIIVDKQKDKILIVSSKEQTANVVKIIQESSISKKADDVNAPGPDHNVPLTNDANLVRKPAIKTAAEINEPVKPVVKGKQIPAEDNDMLGEFINELSEAATAKTKKADAEPKKIEKPAAEVNLSKLLNAEQPPAEKIQTPAEPNLLSQESNESAGQNPAAEKPPASSSVVIPNGDEVLELNLPEKLEIVSLIDLVGRYLKLNYLYDETKITGSVTVKVQGKIRVRELYNLLESVLKFRGFAMSRKGNLVTITPSAEALDQDPRFVEAGIKPGDVTVTKVFHLQNISTATAKRLMGEMKLGSSIMEIAETGTLVVTEYAFRMQRIEELLNLVDVPGPPKEFKLRVLKYTIAESLVTKIKALAEQIGTVEVTIGTSAAAEPAVPGRPRVIRTSRSAPQQPQPSETSAAKATGVYIDSDKRTNRVLIIGLASEIAAVDRIIDSLDVPQQDLRVVQEYEIQYVDIAKVVDALKELNIVEGVSTSKSSGVRTTSGPGQPAPNTENVSQQGAGPLSLDQPQVVMLESTNSLLVNATPEQHIQISRIISYVDREPVQNAIPYRIYRLENQEPEKLAEGLNGLIEKTVKDKEGKIQQTVKYTEESIAIVPDKNTFSLIVYASRKNQEWIGNLIKSLDRRRPQVLIDVSLVEVDRNDTFTFDLDLVGNAQNLVTKSLVVKPLAKITPHSELLEGSFSGGTTTGFYSADKIQALLTLVNSKGYGRVLAQPKILVNDNEEGTINTTDERYVSDSTQSVNGNVGNVISTTTWKAYDAKIELKIKPQISEGDLLRLEIAMVREDFGTAAGPNSPPPKTTSNVTTVVTVPDGSTIILGGLNKLNQNKTGSKMPLLGDVPIVGGLFRTVNNDNVEHRLYIFVKANISRPEAVTGLRQLKNISRKNQVEFERLEDKFQKHEDFPGIKPEPIEPKHILDQDVNELESPEILTKQ